MKQGDIPTWVLIIMFASGLLGLYFMAKDLRSRATT